MATHTTTGGDSYGRKFTISRQNGQNDKNGKPYFFEWLRELPEDQAGRLFETRRAPDGTARHHELFQALDGYLSGLERDLREISGKQRDMLYLKLKDGTDAYEIEIGDYDGRYALDLMKRMLHPDFSLAKKMRVSPYSLIKDSGGCNIGVSVFSGVNKMVAGWKEPHLAGMPEPVKETLRNGDTNWYFDDQARWLFEKVSELISGIPNTAPDAVGNTTKAYQFPVTTTDGVSNDMPTQTTITANHNLPADDPLLTDDLPF